MCVGTRSLVLHQGCWEDFCGSGLGSASAGFGWAIQACIGPLIALFSLASASLSSASTGQNRQHNCFPSCISPESCTVYGRRRTCTVHVAPTVWPSCVSSLLPADVRDTPRRRAFVARPASGALSTHASSA
jgi:hypothetical protein